MADQSITPVAQARKLFRDVRQYPRIRKNPGLSNIGASKTANVLLPVGETYLAILFRFTIAGVAATAAQIITQVTGIKLTVDGDPKIDISGADAAAFIRYYSTPGGIDPIQNGILRLNLHRPQQRTITGEDDAAWGTADVRNLTLEVTLGAGATIDAIDTRRLVVDGENLGRHLCIRRKPRPAPGITTLSSPERINQWNTDLGTSLLCAHINTVDNAMRLNDVRLEIDHIEEINCEYVVLRQQYCVYDRAPQDAQFYQHIDFAARNRLKDGLPMIAQEMNLDLVWRVDPGAYVMLLEQIEGPVAA